jgi:hypothetical protein
MDGRGLVLFVFLDRIANRGDAREICACSVDEEGSRETAKRWLAYIPTKWAQGSIRFVFFGFVSAEGAHPTTFRGYEKLIGRRKPM